MKPKHKKKQKIQKVYQDKVYPIGGRNWQVSAISHETFNKVTGFDLELPNRYTSIIVKNCMNANLPKNRLRKMVLFGRIVVVTDYFDFKVSILDSSNEISQA